MCIDSRWMSCVEALLGLPVVLPPELGVALIGMADQAGLDNNCGKAMFVLEVQGQSCINNLRIVQCVHGLSSGDNLKFFAKLHYMPELQSSYTCSDSTCALLCCDPISLISKEQRKDLHKVSQAKSKTLQTPKGIRCPRSRTEMGICALCTLRK